MRSSIIPVCRVMCSAPGCPLILGGYADCAWPVFVPHSHPAEHRAAGSFPGTESLTPTCLPSIVGLCVSVVTVVAKFIREHFLGITRSVTYDELPDMDRMLHGHLPGPGAGGAGPGAAALCQTHLSVPLARNHWPPPTLLPGLRQGQGKQPSHPKALDHGDSPSAQPHSPPLSMLARL